MLPLVIYHGNCYDGFTAAWVARQKWPTCELYAARYGDPPPIEQARGREVWILDFSYPRAALLELHEASASLRVLDHHKTAQAELDGLDFCTFDMEKSGCRLAWEALVNEHHRDKPPWLLLRIEDRDLWRFKYGEETKLVHAYMASLPMTMAAWDAAFDTTPREIGEQGEGIRRYIDRYCEKAAEEARTVEWNGHRAVIVNVPYQNASEMADVLLRTHPECTFSAGWFQRADRRIQFSLRSRGDFDVSELAKAYGGGGHKGAAGFDVNLTNALEIIG